MVFAHVVTSSPRKFHTATVRLRKVRKSWFSYRKMNAEGVMNSVRFTSISCWFRTCAENSPPSVPKYRTTAEPHLQRPLGTEDACNSGPDRQNFKGRTQGNQRPEVLRQLTRTAHKNSTRGKDPLTISHRYLSAILAAISNSTRNPTSSPPNERKRQMS